MIGLEKLDISAFSIQSATTIIINEAETCVYVQPRHHYEKLLIKYLLETNNSCSLQIVIEFSI